jgi:hypothetical protein
MKNVYKLLGIAALALAIVFSFAACASTGGGTPKTLVITGFPASEAATYFPYKEKGQWYQVGNVLLYPQGANKATDPHVALVHYNYQNIQVSGETYTIPLKTPDGKEWTRSGTLDVAVVSDRADEKSIPYHIFTLDKVDFSGAVTTVAWSDFKSTTTAKGGGLNGASKRGLLVVRDLR